MEGGGERERERRAIKQLLLTLFFNGISDRQRQIEAVIATKKKKKLFCTPHHPFMKGEDIASSNKPEKKG